MVGTRVGFMGGKLPAPFYENTKDHLEGACLPSLSLPPLLASSPCTKGVVCSVRGGFMHDSNCLALTSFHKYAEDLL